MVLYKKDLWSWSFSIEAWRSSIGTVLVLLWGVDRVSTQDLWQWSGVQGGLTWIWLLFYFLRHLTRTSKMDNYISTELKMPNPGCSLSIWRSLKPRANSLKYYSSLPVQSTTVISWRPIRELQFNQLHSQLSICLSLHCRGHRDFNIWSKRQIIFTR